MKKRESNHIVKAASSVLLAGVVTVSTPGVLGAVEAAVDTVDSVDTMSGSTLKIDIKDVEYAGKATDRVAYDAFEVSFDNNTVFQDGVNLLTKAFDQDKIEVRVNGETYEMDEFGKNININDNKKEAVKTKTVEIEEVEEVKEEVKAEAKEEVKEVVVSEVAEELPAGIDTLAGASGGGAAIGGGLIFMPGLSGLDTSHYEKNANFFTIGDKYETIILSKAAFIPGENEIEIDINGKTMTKTIDVDMSEEPVIESVESIPTKGKELPKIKITGTAPANSKVNLALFVKGFEYLELAPITADNSGKFELLIESPGAFNHPEYYRLTLKNGEIRETSVVNLTAVIAVSEDGDKIKSNEALGAFKLNLDEIKVQLDRAENFKSELSVEEEKIRMAAFKYYQDSPFMGIGTQVDLDGFTNKLKTILDKIENRELDTKKLDTALNKEAEVKASAEYKKASNEEKTAYTEAIAAGKAIDENATQDEVDAAARAILNAEYAIMEKAPYEVNTIKYDMGKWKNESKFVVSFKKADGYTGEMTKRNLVYDNIDNNRAEVYVNGVKYNKKINNNTYQKNSFELGYNYKEEIDLDEYSFVNGENTVEIVLGNVRLKKVINVVRTEEPTINVVSVPRTETENEKIVITGKTAPNAVVKMMFYGKTAGDIIRLRSVTADENGDFRLEYKGIRQSIHLSECVYEIPGLDTDEEETVHKTAVLNLYDLCARVTDGDKIISNEVVTKFMTDITEMEKTVRIFQEFLEKNKTFKLNEKDVSLFVMAKADIARHTYETALSQSYVDKVSDKLNKIMADSGLEIPADPGEGEVTPEPEKPEVQSEINIVDAVISHKHMDHCLVTFDKNIEDYVYDNKLEVEVNGTVYTHNDYARLEGNVYSLESTGGNEKQLELSLNSIKNGNNTIIVKGENIETKYELNVKGTEKPEFTVKSIPGTDTEKPKIEINVKANPETDIEVNMGSRFNKFKLNEVKPGEYTAVLTGTYNSGQYSFETIRKVEYIYGGRDFHINAKDKGADIGYSEIVNLSLNTEKAQEAIAAVPEAAMSNEKVEAAVAELKKEIGDKNTIGNSQQEVDKNINKKVEALNKALEGALGEVKDAKIAEIEALEISEEAKAGMTPESIKNAEAKLEKLKKDAIAKVRAAATVAAVTEVPAVNVKEAEAELVKAVEEYKITGVEFSEKYGAHYLVTLNKSVLDNSGDPKVTEVTVNDNPTKFTVEDKDGNNKQLEIDATAFQNGENTIKVVIDGETVEYKETIEKTALEAEVVSVPSTDSERPKIKVTVKSEEGAEVTCEIAGLNVALTETTPGVFTGELTDKAEGYYADGEYANANDINGKTSHIAVGAGIKITAKAGEKVISESNTKLALSTELAEEAVKAAEGIEDEKIQKLKEELSEMIEGVKNPKATIGYQIEVDRLTNELNKALETVTPEPEKPDNHKPSRPSRNGGGSSSSNTSNATGSRIAGDSRVATAVAVSKDMYKNGTSTVIIANMNKFSDVLTAAPLASQKKAPILFVNADSIPQETMDEIKRLGAKNIFINGGEASVSKNVEKQLDGMKIERFAGADRYETAAKIAEKIRENGSKSIVEVANGEIFADALSMSSLAVKENAPIVLVQKNALPAASQKALLSWKDDVKKVNIAGSTGSVSDVAEKVIAANTNIKVARFGGANRYETSAKIAKAARSTATKAVYTSGEKFADALVAGPFAAKNNAPILLVQKNNVPASIEKYTKDADVSKIFVIGGESTITKTVIDKLVDAAK